jgi:hypothetical protein
VEFLCWLETLRQSAGESYLWAINRISPHILKTFWEEGCEPTLEGVIRHCEYDSLQQAEPGTPEPTRPPGSAFSPRPGKCGPAGNAFAAESGGGPLQM